MTKSRSAVIAVLCLPICFFSLAADAFQTKRPTIYKRLSKNLAASDYDYLEDEGTKTKSKRRVIRVSTSSTKQAEQHRKEAEARHQQALKDPTLLSNVKFEERNDIHPATKRAILEVMGLQSMTEIQSKTYAEGMSW